MKQRMLSFVAAAALVAAPLAMAQVNQQTPPQQTGNEPMMNQPMQRQKMENPMPSHTRNRMRQHSTLRGSHNMPGTVTSVDHTSGIVKLTSEGKHLTVHFPPSAITQLKDGDHISLHLAYRITGQD